MKQITLVSAAVLIALGFAIDANAGDRGERRGPPAFADIDSNADSLISFEEIEALKANRGHKGGRKHKEGKDPQARFNEMDTDGDGYWSEAEFDAAGEKMREKMRERRKHRHNQDAADDESEDETGA